MTLNRQIFAHPAPPTSPPPPVLADPRFRALLPAGDWASLPAPIRRRFSKRLAGDESAIYRGEVVETRMSPVGWCLAQAARIFGAPLPLSREAGVAAVV